MPACTLVTDGPSDDCLIPILKWTFAQVDPALLPRIERANLGLYAPGNSLRAKINAARDLYPCDLLLVHRDAENGHPDLRVREIRDAVGTLPHASIVPVKMSEAWLLIDERAIRIAAGNPNGTMHLDMPRVNQIEDIRWPKDRLHELLETACGLRGRALKKFHPDRRKRLVADNISNFQPLNTLPSYIRFRESLRQSLATLPRE